VKGKFFIGLALLLAAYAAPAQMPYFAATVNDTGITRSMVQAQVDALINQRGFNYGGITHPSEFKRMQREVVEQLITQELLWQEAQRREFVADDNIVDQQLEQIKDGFDSPQAFLFKIQEGGFTETSFREDVKQQLSVQRMVSQGIALSISISDEEAASFYTTNIDQMQQPVEVRARHILIKQESAKTEAQTTAKGEIEEILAEIRAGGDFAKLAMEHSQGPSATQGGDLGFFGPGQMVPPFEKAAFALQPGEVSEVVQTQFGYHIIKLEDRRGGETAPLEDAADSIRAYLTQQRLQSEVETLVATLRDEGDVEIFLNL